MKNEIITAMTEKMDNSMATLKKELTRIRTGRASLALLDGIKVTAYGAPQALNQVANLTIPESRMIVIQAWDMQLLGAIEKAIQKSDLGLNPVNDGKVLRLGIPQLTEERRKDLVKQVRKIGEEYKVAIRNSRREAIDALKKKKNSKELSEDDLFKLQENAQKMTDKYIATIDSILNDKEKEVMEV
ncbi:MAG: ribosome recycling factor [Deltaproteobacteria bacterium RIFOXYD12_FULL_50_9]|nr:MAG: ribosome recycling factor [Deltaproteobacteria bacterium RIFOXYD12_FULL_50_9]